MARYGLRLGPFSDRCAREFFRYTFSNGAQSHGVRQEKLACTTTVKPLLYFYVLLSRVTQLYASRHNKKGMFPTVLTLHMDFHKCLPTPKLSAQDWHYCSKLRTNLLGIYCGNERKIHCFLYDDSIGGTGPNEVISFLHYIIKYLRTKHGKYDQLIVWTDNSPGQFKENYLFFFMDHLVRTGEFLRTDLKFLLEGHSYSVCDRRFGSIQAIFDKQERIEVPQQWITTLRDSNLSNVQVHSVTLDMIKDYKSFLRLKYVSRNEDQEEKTKFEVKKIAWLNFGFGEVDDGGEGLKLVYHPDTAFVRFHMDPKEKPKTVSYVKKKQGIDLAPEMLNVFRQQKKPIRDDVKKNCVKLAQKYLAETAENFYASLPSCNEEHDD